MNNKNPRPQVLPYKADFCLRYAPKSNIEAFIDEI